MSNFLFLSTQHPFEEKEEQIKETYKEHCKKYYIKLKEEYEKNLAEERSKLISQ